MGETKKNGGTVQRKLFGGPKFPDLSGVSGGSSLELPILSAWLTDTTTDVFRVDRKF